MSFLFIYFGFSVFRYTPQKWVREHYGNEHAGPRLLKFVEDHFLHRVKLPKGTTMLLT